MKKRHHKTETSISAQVLNESELTVTSGSVEQDQKGKAKSHAVVQLCAHQKWEAAGRPNGDGVKFWLEAERELLQTK